MSSRKTQKAARRADAEARATQEARTRRTRRLLIATAATAAIAAVIGVVAITATAPSAEPATPPTVTTAPPWSAPADPGARAKAAGLQVSPMEGSALHTHQHLSITVDGHSVTVPANLGIDTQNGAMSALHTHDSSGVIHLESATVATFTLGQLFTEWGIKLAAHQVGGYTDGRDGRRVTLFVNGTASSTPLRKLKLTDRQDIAIVITSDTVQPAAPAPFDWGTA